MSTARQISYKSGRFIPIVIIILMVWSTGGYAGWYSVEDVDASSTVQTAGWELLNVIDGQVGWNHCWSSACYQDNGNHTEWLSVELDNAGDATALATIIKLTPRPDAKSFPKDFALQYSTNAGSTWTTIPGHEYSDYAAPANNNPISFSFSAIDAHYFRVYATELRDDGVGNYALQFAEIEVGGYSYLPIDSASASSTTQTEGWDLANAIDGGYGWGECWSSNCYQDNGNHTEWLSVKLDNSDAGTNHGVTALILTPRPDAKCFPKDFRIQYSNDAGSTWYTVAGHEYNDYTAPATSAPVVFGFDCLDAYYLRVVATELRDDGVGNYALQFAEMTVAGQDGTCLGCTHTELTYDDAAASSEITNWEAVNVIDGQTGWWQCWSSTCYQDNGNHTEYITVKLDNTDRGENHTVNLIRLTPRPDGKSFPENFRIDYATDVGSTWYTIPSQQYTSFPEPRDATPISFSFDAINAYYIRIYATKLRSDGSGNYAFQLDEIEVDGQDAMWPFHSSLADDPDETYNYTHYIDADLNNMFSIFGIAANEDPSQQCGPPQSPQTAGVCYWGEPVAWATYVLADKLAWLNHWWTPSIVKENIHNMIHYRDTDGYVWLCKSQADYMGEGYHFDQNSKYLIGVANLSCFDGNTEWISDNIEALREIMDYQMDYLNGSNNLLIINDANRPPSGNPDNNGRFFNPDNQGLGGESSNYWDQWPFGYKSAEDNIHFYASLLAMAKIERLYGNETNATAYENAAASTKTSFNNNFWDSNKGRYIGCIDIDSASHDYGFTFLNLEALHYGLGDQDKADDIFDWLDGNRTVDGDTSTGSDIYAYVFAPRVNTKSAESVQQNGLYWWYSNNGDTNRCADYKANNTYPDPICTWDNNHENGGPNFHVSFYDIMARIKYLGADDAFDRLREIIEEFHDDQLRRDPVNNEGLYWKYGVTGEYPESGLVPMVYFYGFMGISVDADQMTIKPQLPTEMSYLQVQSVNYRGAILDIKATSTSVQIHCTSNPVGRTFTFEGESVSGTFDKTKSLSSGDVALIPTN